MKSEWPDWLYHGGPYCNMMFMSIKTSGNDNFNAVQSKAIRFKSLVTSNLCRVNEGIPVWINDQGAGTLQIKLNMSETTPYANPLSFIT